MGKIETVAEFIARGGSINKVPSLEKTKAKAFSKRELVRLLSSLNLRTAKALWFGYSPRGQTVHE
jgi:hypothetical protein